LRADMPGGWSRDDANAFTGIGLSAAQREAQDYTRALFEWRKHTPLLHTGKLTHFAPQDGVYVYVRHQGDKAVMVALNRNTSATSLPLDRFDAFLHGRSARDALTGKPVELGVSLQLPALSATLLELERL